MRQVLNRFDHPGRDLEVAGRPDPLIVGPASRLFEEGEMDARPLGPVTPTSRTTDFSGLQPEVEDDRRRRSG